MGKGNEQGLTVDQDARWQEIQRMSDAIALRGEPPSELESALCGAVWRAREALKALTQPSETKAGTGETPRTDAKILVNHRTPGGNDVVHADFARQLERDLNEARVLLANQAQAVIAMNQSPSSAGASEKTATMIAQEHNTDPTIQALAKAAGWVGVSDPLRYLERYIARTEKLAGRKVMVDGTGGVFNVPDESPPPSAALSPTPHPDTARLDWLLDNCLYLPIRYRDPLPGNCRAAIDHAMNAAPQAPCEPRPTTPGPSNRIAPTADHAAGPAERDSLAQPAAPAVSPSSSTRAPTDE